MRIACQTVLRLIIGDQTTVATLHSLWLTSLVLPTPCNRSVDSVADGRISRGTSSGFVWSVEAFASYTYLFCNSYADG